MVVLAFAALACVFRRDQLVAFCGAALAGPIVFHCFIAGVALSFYWTLWMPPLLVLTALGVEETARRLQTASLPAVVQVGVPVIALLVPAAATLSLAVRTADVKPVGPEVLRPVLAHHGLRGPVLSTGIYQYEYTYYDPGMGVYYSQHSLASVNAVVVGAPQCRLEPDSRTARTVVAINLAARHLRKIYVDRAMTVYQVTGPLVTPSPAQIAGQPPTNLAAGC
jgi:hypothetical protein